VAEPSRSPTGSELRAWEAFLRAHSVVTRALERELVADQQITLGSYDVLLQLARAPGRRLRMAELADAVLLSRSGITRLVDRLERSGWVSRQRVAGDGRGVIAALTPAGLETLRKAAATHLAGITRNFVVHFDNAQLAQLSELCARLIEAPVTARSSDS
jgi:DNA-binding MarR family transcriptional regulator